MLQAFKIHADNQVNDRLEIGPTIDTWHRRGAVRYMTGSLFRVEIDQSATLTMHVSPNYCIASILKQVHVLDAHDLQAVRSLITHFLQVRSQLEPQTMFVLARISFWSYRHSRSLTAVSPLFLVFSRGFMTCVLHGRLGECPRTPLLVVDGMPDLSLVALAPRRYLFFKSLKIGWNRCHWNSADRRFLIALQRRGTLTWISSGWNLMHAVMKLQSSVQSALYGSPADDSFLEPNTAK